MDESLLRDYHLGRLPEAKREEIEARFFEDEEFAGRLESVRHDLLDDWARGRLSGENRLAVERRFEAQEMAIARAIAEKNRPSRRFAAWPLAAAAAAVFCILFAGYLWQNLQGLNRQAPELPAPAPPKAVATFLLQGPVTRGETGRTRTFTIPPGTDLVRLETPVDQEFESFEIRLLAAGRGQVAQETGPNARITVKAQDLAPGAFEFLVYGRKNGVRKLVAAFPFQIQ